MVCACCAAWKRIMLPARQTATRVKPSAIVLAVLVLVSRAHGSEAAMIAKPVFEAYANEVGRGGIETQSISRSDVDVSDGKLTSSSRLTGSAIKVHLVHDNITEELSL